MNDILEALVACGAIGGEQAEIAKSETFAGVPIIRVSLSNPNFDIVVYDNASLSGSVLTQGKGFDYGARLDGDSFKRMEVHPYNTTVAITVLGMQSAGGYVEPFYRTNQQFVDFLKNQ